MNIIKALELLIKKGYNMKLRNKKTGKIIDLEFWGIFTDGDAIGFESEYEDENEYCYNSIAELNEEWEDYTPQEPLIKDEKIRKAVRAWVNANRWTDDVRLEFNDFGYHESWSLEQHTDNNEIHFSGRMPNCMHKQLYTITELCGEDEDER